MQRVRGSFPGRDQKFDPSLLAPLLDLTCGLGAMDDEDLTVSFNQDIT